MGFAALRSAFRRVHPPLVAPETTGRPPRLVLRFGVYCALALTLAAAASFWFLRQHATESAQEGVGFRARSMAYTLLRDQLRPADLARPVAGERRAALDELFTRQVLIEGARTVRVTLWAPDGTLTYSNTHGLIGTRRADPRVRRALHGETVLEVERIAEVAGARSRPKVLTAFVPVRLTGGVRASGVLEVSEDYAPVAREVRASVKPVALVLGLVLLGLYASLFPILRRVTRALVGRNRALAEQARELERSLREREAAEAALREKTALLQLLESVAAAANEAATVEDAAQTCLELVCAHTGWPVGHAYLRQGGPSSRLVPARTWHLADAERYEPFRVATMALPFVPGSGLSGAAMAKRRPVWMSDVSTEPRFRRAEVASACELHAAFAFPVLVGDEVAGVLEFFSAGHDEPDRELLDLMVHVGTQLGRVIERVEAAGEALRESEARFRAVFERAAVGIVITDVDGRVTAANSAFEDMLGFREDELPGMRTATLVHPDDRDASVASSNELAAGQRDHYGTERRYLRGDGEVVWGRVTASLVRAADGSPQFEVAMVENITGQKELEEQLRQSQKMEAVGRLAGGVAHDFNNLLTVISGYADVLVAATAADDPARPRLDAIRHAAEQASGLTAQLLAFSRKQVLQPKVLDLNAIVADTETMLRRLIGEDVQLTATLEPRLGLVRADPTQVGQVLLNLVVNARDAMPGGGRIEIATGHHDEAAPGGALAPGPYVTVAVTDSGQGMDEETQARIFEPFFTTKEHGRGTGLGLATVYGIVAQSGGGIAVRSAPGAGSTFTVYLPRLDEAAAVAAPVGVAPRAAAGTETLLLVEDEVAVRALVRDVLADEGYEVLEATSVDDALALSDRYGHIDAVVTDVVMPGMSGPALVAELSRSRPGLKAVYMSGYTDDAVARDAELHAGTRFLQKPFALDALRHTLRDLLDDGHGLREVA